MKGLIGAFLAVSAIVTIGLLSGAPAIPARACVIANFKNAVDPCPPGTTFGSRNASNMDDAVVEPAAAPAEASGCVKSNVKSFKNACPK